ncbi:MAG: heavy metal translocating P-type ATPase [Candidatus Woesearchaeota archaeon]
MGKNSYEISGMHCASCANSIEKGLNKEKKVISAKVNIATNKLFIDTTLTEKEIQDKLKQIGNFKIQSKENNNITLQIVGITCSSCVSKIEKSLNKLHGINSARVNIATSKASINYDASKINFLDIVEDIKKNGYKVVKNEKNDGKKDLAHEELKIASKRMWFSVAFAGPLMVLMMIDMFVFMVPYYLIIIALMGAPVIFIAGFETHKSAFRSVINLSPNMDTLVTLGSLIPYTLSLLALWFPVQAFIEMATTILSLHLVGRYLEAKAKGRASNAIKKLFSLGAKKATILVNNVEKEISIEALKVGDIMVIKPGEKIPTDGEIIKGETSIDESMATGESLPVQKKKGDNVIGSTINKNGRILVKATKIGDDTFLSQIIKLVEECQGSKVPIQEFADKVTGYFVPGVIFIALAAFGSWLLFPEIHIRIVEFFNFPWTNPTAPLLTLAILASTAVLVISCPCALGLATPTALMVGSGLGAEKGILIRKGEAIQTMKDLKCIIFDKTGTLTNGKPEVTDILTYNNFTKKDVLYYSASLEKSSEHPLATAFIEKSKENNIELKEATNFKAISGKGIKGKINKKVVLVGNTKLMKEYKIDYEEYQADLEQLENEAKTSMFISINNKVAGIIAVADTLKENSEKAILEIHKMGIKTAMITGDNNRTAKAIAAKIGIDDVISDVLPEGKVIEVKRLQKKYGLVGMVGDGINDAPALKQANVGIAIGTGTDIAIEAADITLVRGNLGSLISAIKLSNATFRKIKQNYFWAWFYNAVAIPAAFLGLLHPMIGAGAMALSSVNVVLNSIRLKYANINPRFKE